MTLSLVEAKTNGNSLAQIDGETLSKLVLGGDLSKLNDEQTLAYYAYRCKALGLDPGTKPFDLLTLNGKKVMYATKECSAQISQRDKLSVTVVSDGSIGDIYRVVARAQSPDGRATDDMGCVNIKGLSGDNLCNAMMKATTKAKRRAILTHAGLGMMDETEIETVSIKPTRDQKPAPAPTVKREGDDAETVPASVTDAAAPANEPVVAVERPEGCVRSGILEVTEKSGHKKDGTPYTNYGVKLTNNAWVNTFSETDGAKAKKCKDGGLDCWILTQPAKNPKYTDLIYIEPIEG